MTARTPVTTCRVVALTVLLTALSAVAAWAHDTWLLPASLRVPVGQTVEVSLTSGMAFPADDFAIAPARVTRAVVRLGGLVTPLAPGRARPMALRYTWRPSRDGVATFGVELAPRTLVLTPDKVAEYLDEIDASAELRDRWQRLPAPKRWRESYAKHAKSYVRVGEPARDTSWGTPIGLGLELVPGRDPTDLHPGDTLPIRVLRRGTALPGFHVGALAAGATKASFFTTDADGIARVVLPSAGLWLLNGTDLRRSTKPNLEWESDFSTLTLAVRPPR